MNCRIAFALKMKTSVELMVHMVQGRQHSMWPCAIYSIMHAACHATRDLKFGSCTALSSSSPVIEASKLVTVEVESWSQTPSL